MAPPTGPRRHYHCSFRMPHNPQYECPRAAKMYQSSGGVYYCSYHDKYSKNRCQAFLEFQGSGMQCLDLAVMIDGETGRRYCPKHEPPTDIAEIVDWKKKMTEWLESVAIGEAPQKDDGCSCDMIAEDAESELLDLETELEHIAALYSQCNICLEKHNSADMKKIESCGHQYRESCLQDFLRREGVRKYNCTGCASWMRAHQET